MKYLLALLGGMLVGAALFALLLYLNPLAKRISMSPLSVSASSQMELSYSAVPSEAIAWVSNGIDGVASHPARVQDLWEPSVRDTRLLLTTLRNSRGQMAGVGVKFTTGAEETGLLNGVIPVNSAWHIWLIGRGGLFIDQSENHWPLWRDIVLAARLSSGNEWRGSWYGIMTSGPGALGTASLSGGSGEFAAVESEAVEALTAKAYSVQAGPVAMEGRLSLALPGTR